MEYEKLTSTSAILEKVKLLDPKKSSYLQLEHYYLNTLEILNFYKDESTNNSTAFSDLKRCYNKELEICVNSTSAKGLEDSFKLAQDAFYRVVCLVYLELDPIPEEWSLPRVNREYWR